MARCRRTPGAKRAQPGGDELPVAEPGADLTVLAPAHAPDRPGVHFLPLDGDRAELRQLGPRQPEAGDGHVAAGRHGGPELGHDPLRLITVLAVMQDSEEKAADGR